MHPYLHQDHAQIRTNHKNDTQNIYNKRFQALLISRNKVLQQWPKGAWSQATYLAEGYGRETALLVVSRAGLL